MWQLLAFALAQNCLHDYLLSREDSCFFGSQSSRVSLLADVENRIQNCDLETCKCPTGDYHKDRLNGTASCDAFSMQAMLQFIPVHGEPDDTTADIYKNISRIISDACVHGNLPGEPADNEVKFTFGACGPTRLPGSGHNAGIVAYVSVMAGLATFVYLYSDQTLAVPVSAFVERRSAAPPVGTLRQKKRFI